MSNYVMNKVASRHYCAKGKKVIYFGFSDQHKFKIINELWQKYEWMPVYQAGLKISRITTISEYTFTNCVMQEALSIRLANFNYDAIGKKKPVDAQIIQSLSSFSPNLIGILKDSTGWNYSYEERKRYYYEVLHYWNTVILNLKPDLIVFFTWPHTPACYPLYLLGKHYYNINILFIDPVPLLNLNYHFVGNSLEALHERITNIYKSNLKLSLTEEAKRYLDVLASTNAEIPKHIQHVYQKDKYTKINLIQKAKKIGLSLLNSSKTQVFYDDMKKNKKPYYKLNSRMDAKDLLLFNMTMRKKNTQLNKVYNKLCNYPDLDANYIYFAAPYQPESVSNIMAGVYEDVILTLDLLNAALPDNWHIYYKEHPGIFLESFQGSLKRSKEFYLQIKKNCKVQFIRADFSTFQLIDHSQAVATIGGTAAWESVVRGRPAISFGNAWHHGCKGIFVINKYQDLINGIDSIRKGFKPKKEDIERYVASIEEVSSKNILHNQFNDRVIDTTSDMEMKKIAKLLFDSYNQIYN